MQKTYAKIYKSDNGQAISLKNIKKEAYIDIACSKPFKKGAIDISIIASNTKWIRKYLYYKMRWYKWQK